MTKIVRFAAIINGLAVLVIGLARNNSPAGYWTNRDHWVVIALFLTALVPVVQVFVNERGELARRKSIEREKKLEAFLTAALRYIVGHARADWEDTGVQVFLVRRKKGFWKVQSRAAKVRLASVPSSGIEWTEGKGMIGRCWKTRAYQAVDLQAHFAPHLECTAAQWNELSEDTRYGLTFEDFSRVGSRYGFVAAAPILDAYDKYLGCVSMDMPPKRDGDADALVQGEVRKALTTTAVLVCQVL